MLSSRDCPTPGSPRSSPAALRRWSEAAGENRLLTATALQRLHFAPCQGETQFLVSRQKGVQCPARALRPPEDPRDVLRTGRGSSPPSTVLTAAADRSDDRSPPFLHFKSDGHEPAIGRKLGLRTIACPPRYPRRRRLSATNRRSFRRAVSEKGSPTFTESQSRISRSLTAELPVILIDWSSAGNARDGGRKTEDKEHPGDHISPETTHKRV